MCGIAGVVSSQPDPALTDLAAGMNETLRHRGPDGVGLFTCASGRAALAHRRLAIIDLETGAQPMTDAEGRRTIVFNGEIYNFQMLRVEQEARGRAFATRSDTETILAGLALDGEPAIGKLRGMFAFAVWDALEHRLLLARDRFGKKPLFYAEHAGRFYFASELKAILKAHPAPEVDRVALFQYLILGYVPGNRTLYRGIHRLPPAHLLRLDRRGVTLERYWELPAPDDREDGRSIADWDAQIDATLMDAVRLRMISEVPLGAFLSGGLDSSTIVALCLENVARPFHTFSIRIEGARSADADAAREVSAHLRTTHHDEVLRCPAPDELVGLFRHFDEPFGDSSMIPTAAVSRAARREVTVALSGDGGDELFGGYPVYALQRDMSRWARVPFVGRTAAMAVSVWPRRLPGKEGLARLGSTDDERYLQTVAHAYGEPLRRLAGGSHAELDEALREVRDLFCSPHPHVGVVARAQWIDASRSYLTGDILTKVDMASMAASLEVRAPFLDHVLAEQLASLPASLRMVGARGKLLLRRIAARHLPERIIERKKIGFSVPIGDWLAGPLRPLMDAYLLSPSSAVSSYVDGDVVRRLITGVPSASPTLQFTLLSLGVWAARGRD